MDKMSSKKGVQNQISVLHFCCFKNPGGVEVFLMNVYRRINRDKVSFDFLVGPEGPYYFSEEISSLGGRMLPQKKLMGRNKVARQFEVRKHIRQVLLKEGPFDIVHIHAQNALHCFAVRAVLDAGIKNVIYHSHNSEWPGKFLHFAFRPYLNRLPIIKLACSTEAGKWMYGKKGKFQIINNGIDTKKFAFNGAIRNGIRTDLGIQDKFVIGHVGRFAEQKNHPFLIDIFNEVSKLNPNVVLMLIGRGEKEEAIKAKVRDLNLSDKVIFLGVKDNISEYLQAMDLFLLPSLHEGLPVTMVEAQAAGLKCVVSDVITKEADLTGVKYISLAQTAEAWAKILLSIELKHDRKSWYEKVKTSGFDIEDTVKAIEEIYLSVE